MSITQVGVKCLVLGCDGSRFLALRRAPGLALQQEEFDIPGGRLEHGEEPIAGLVREVREEVGLDLRDASGLVLLDAGNVVADADRHIVRLTYFYVLSRDDVTPILSGEHTEWCWRELCADGGYHPLLNRAIGRLREWRAKGAIP